MMSVHGTSFGLHDQLPELGCRVFGAWSYLPHGGVCAELGYAFLAEAVVGHEFGLMKLLANLTSYIAGIPGGLFSPALAVGAGLGHNLAVLMPAVDLRAFVLLGMCAYLTGVTRAPLTSAVISLELTDSGDLLLPVLATVLIARGVSRLVCRIPIYRGLAEQLMPHPRRDASGAS